MENSFKVFLKSDETDRLSVQINTLLSSLQNVFQETEEIHNLRGFLPQYFDPIKYKDGEVQKRGGVGEFIKGNGGGFEKYLELNEYSPFYKNRDMGSISKWAKWRNDGTKQMNGNYCPFCTHQMDIDKIGEQNEIIAKVFKNSALSTANAVLEYVQKAVENGYINSEEVEVLNGYIGNSSREDALYAELQQLAVETNYLLTKIEKILLFRPMNVSHDQLECIENNLDEMLIDPRQLSKFYTTELIKELVETIKSKIEELKTNTGKLKGLFIQHDNKMKKIIEDRKDDINQFFALAGFPYNFVIKGNGENKAVSYLIPCNMSEQDKITQPEKHLSWGERNAFSLVMFMFEALSSDVDLIVLDDPITSFDKDKKFAIIRRLFDNQKPSFRDKTVLMLTHELQPIIDYIYSDFFSRLGLTTPVNAKLIQNEDSIIKEYPIEKSDLLNTVELTKKVACDSNKIMAIRVVNLRKYIEITDSEYSTSPIYEVLSNLIHGREVPENANKGPLDSDVLNTGCEEITSYLGELTYDDILAELSKDNLLLLIHGDNVYENIIAIRLLFERCDGLLGKLRKSYPAACKFVNETNHIENDYIFQLDPFKFFSIPTVYLNEINEFIKEEILA